VLEDRRNSELDRFLVLEQVINALRSEFEEQESDPGGGLLRCVECRCTSSPDAAGWRGYIGYDVRDDEPPEVFTFCPECAEGESNASG
jgi:hypothetical protein